MTWPRSWTRGTHRGGAYPAAAPRSLPPHGSFLVLARGDPPEVPVIGEARRPLRRRFGKVGGRGIVETLYQRSDPIEHGLDQLAGIVPADRTALPDPNSAAQPPIFERRRDTGDRCEAAVSQDCPFERELRREARCHLFFRGQRSGLVVDQQETSGSEAVDAVCLGRQGERPAGRGQGQAARTLAQALEDAGPVRPLLGYEPRGDSLEARPPEGPNTG